MPKLLTLKIDIVKIKNNRIISIHILAQNLHTLLLVYKEFVPAKVWDEGKQHFEICSMD